MTTNDGTPMIATKLPWKRPISAVTITAMMIATSPVVSQLPSGNWSFADDHAGDPRHVPDREVDLAEQEDEDDADGDGRHRGHLHHQVREVPRGEEVRVLRVEERRDHAQPDDDGHHADVSRLPGLPSPPRDRAEAVLVRLGRDASIASSASVTPVPPCPVWSMPGDLRRDAGGDGVDDLLLRRLAPLEDGGVASEPEHRDPVGHLEDVVEVVGDEDDGEPLLGEPPDEVEHLPRLGDAERGRRLVEDDDAGVPHHGTADRDGLALAAREARDLLSDRADRSSRRGPSAPPPSSPPSRAP